MKRIFKYALCTLLLGSLFAGCEKETTPERVNVQHPEEQEQIHRDNAYYQRLREYKKSKHKLAFGWYGTWTAMGPSYQTRISNCPDSMDIISIWSQWHTLTPAQVADKEFVQKVKGTKVTYTIFSNVMPEPFASMYDDPYCDEAIEAYAKAYCKDSMDKWNYDGIDIDYEPGFGAVGPFVGNPAPELFNKLIVAMGKYVGPKSGTGRLFIIDGVPFAVRGEYVDYFDYGIVQAYSSYGYTDLQNRFNNAANAGWKPEQYIFAENFEAYWKTGGVSHTTRDGQTVNSLLGMALFNPTQGEGGGFGAYHMEYEYAHADMPYKYMRQAIQAVNPAPVGDYSKTLVALNEAGTEQFEVSVTPSGVIYGEVNCTLSARISEPAEADTDLALAVDNSLIESYNHDNGTEYAAIDPSLVNISGPLHFAAGTEASESDVQVAVTVASLADGEYLVPLLPTLAEGFGYDETGYVKYLVITKSTTTIKVLTDGSQVENHSVMKRLDGSYSSLEATLTAHLSLGAISDVQFGYVADNALAEAYNEKNGTDYMTIDASKVSLSGKLSFAQGEMSPTGGVTVTLSDLSVLQPGYTLVALRPDLESLSDYEPDADRGVKYLLIFLGEENLAAQQNLEPFEDDCTKIDNANNKLGWTVDIINLNTSIGGTGVWGYDDVTTLFNGRDAGDMGFYAIFNNYYSWQVGLGGRITIDMQQSYPVSTVAWGVCYTNTAYSVKTIRNVEVSTDGVNWTPQNAGDVTIAQATGDNGVMQWFTFVKPVEARLIRFDIVDRYDTGSNFCGMRELEVWSPKN